MIQLASIMSWLAHKQKRRQVVGAPAALRKSWSKSINTACRSGVEWWHHEYSTDSRARDGASLRA